jgi:DNA-binding GntR family transcriptional regulator
VVAGGPTFVRKSDQVAALIRARIADGSLRAGMYAPSGAELAKETGFAIVTCRRGLQRL